MGCSNFSNNLFFVGPIDKKKSCTDLLSFSGTFTRKVRILDGGFSNCYEDGRQTSKLKKCTRYYVIYRFFKLQEVVSQQ